MTSKDPTISVQLGPIEPIEQSHESRSVQARMPGDHPLVGHPVSVGASRRDGAPWSGPWHHMPSLPPMTEEDFGIYAGAVLALFQAYRERYR